MVTGSALRFKKKTEKLISWTCDLYDLWFYFRTLNVKPKNLNVVL